jgi:hypothetical protein
MKRPDAIALSRMVRKGYINRKEALELAALPLMFISFRRDKTTGGDTEWTTFAENFTRSDMLLTMEEFSFHDCVVWIEADNVDDYVYSRMQILSDTQYRVGIFGGVNSAWITNTITYDTVDDSFKTNIYRLNDTVGVDNIVREYRLTKDSVARTGEFAVELLAKFQAFCIYNNRQDRYAVSMEPVTRKPIKGDISFRERLERTAGPSIVYLDKLPTNTAEQTVVGKLTGREVSPHSRRGYHYTLRAERYRNHPYYGIEKKMYRKPTYVGDRTSIVNGTIYTILDK